MKRLLDFTLGCVFIIALVAAFLYGKHRADERWLEYVSQYCTPASEDSPSEGAWDYSQYRFYGDI